MAAPPRKIYLLPGQVHVSRLPTEITTVLGSCVAVCVWDVALQQGGMNHYLLPQWHQPDAPTAKYGDIAIRILVERLRTLGSQSENLRAKIYGGAATIENMTRFNVGERNIEMAEQAMRQMGIRVLTRHTGGTQGRKIIFSTDTGQLTLLPLKG